MDLHGCSVMSVTFALVLDGFYHIHDSCLLRCFIIYVSFHFHIIYFEQCFTFPYIRLLYSYIVINHQKGGDCEKHDPKR